MTKCDKMYNKKTVYNIFLTNNYRVPLFRPHGPLGSRGKRSMQLQCIYPNNYMGNVTATTHKDDGIKHLSKYHRHVSSSTCQRTFCFFMVIPFIVVLYLRFLQHCRLLRDTAKRPVCYIRRTVWRSLCAYWKWCQELYLRCATGKPINNFRVSSVYTWQS